LPRSHPLLLPRQCREFGRWDPSLGTDHGNNLDTDPLFVLKVDPLTAPTTAPGGLRLLNGSPAINAGDDLANTTTTDLAGKPRKIGTIDLGAYEGGVGITFAALHPGLDPNGDANGNGVSNFADYATGGDPTAPDDPTLRPKLISNQLTFSYRSNANDINVQYEKSTTLLPGSWNVMVLDTDYTINNTSTNSGRTIETIRLLSRAGRTHHLLPRRVRRGRDVSPDRWLNHPGDFLLFRRNQLPGGSLPCQNGGPVIMIPGEQLSDTANPFQDCAEFSLQPFTESYPCRELPKSGQIMAR
ncbi:MAG: hypothetical protein K9N23_20055, partial [Akkermansiaceae bacterium]|nr:hypothetical protein [Akkermansiaceae bacterium]